MGKKIEQVHYIIQVVYLMSKIILVLAVANQEKKFMPQEIAQPPTPYQPSPISSVKLFFVCVMYKAIPP